MSKKKILLIWPFFSPDPGAAAARGAAFEKYLGQEYRIDVITKNNRKFKHYADHTNTKRIDVKISILPWAILTDFVRIFKTIHKINADITIASSPNILFSFYGALVTHILNKTFYLDVRDLSIVKQGIKEHILRYIDTFSYKSAKKVFVTTVQQRDMTHKQFNIDTTKIEIIPNGIDLSEFPTCHNDIDARPIDILFSGSLNPERNIEGIILLLSDLYHAEPNLNITFVGIDKENIFTTRFIEQIRKESFFFKITFIPEVTHQEVFNLLKKTKIGLVTISDSEKLDYQMPVKIFEYMAAGACVAGLSPRENTIYKFITTKQSGIVFKSPKELAFRLNKLLRDPISMHNYQQRNFQTIKQYDRQEIIKSVSKIIKSDE